MWGMVKKKKEKENAGKSEKKGRKKNEENLRSFIGACYAAALGVAFIVLDNAFFFSFHSFFFPFFFFCVLF